MLTIGLSSALRADRRFGRIAVARFGDARGGAARVRPRDKAADPVGREQINNVINSITLIKDRQQAETLISKCLGSDSARIISFLNAHGLNLCHRDREFANALLQSDVILRDGIGMQLLFKALKSDAGLNMNGTDLIPEILDCARGETLGVFGTSEPYLSDAAKVLEQAGHDVVVCADGFKDAACYLALIERHRPTVVVLAMGMPKQELVASYLKENTSYNPLLINGGAVVDFIAGKVRRAPRWLREIHMEWVFRLLHEPRRLFRRYTLGNLLFLIRIKNIRKTYGAAPDAEIWSFEDRRRIG